MLRVDKIFEQFFNTFLIELKFRETQIWKKYSIPLTASQGHRIGCIRVDSRKSAQTLWPFTHI